MPRVKNRQPPYTTTARFLLALLALVQYVSAEDVASVPVVVEPKQAELVGNLSRLQLVVTGRKTSGRAFDLTREAKYENHSPDILSVDETGLVVPRASGAGRIQVRHGNNSIDVSVSVRDVVPQAIVSFRQDVVPILSKAGCNQGACHATQFGKGGLKLSLFGYAPEQDYSPLARDHRQRRVSLLKPEDSLILRKPTMEIGHGGGRRFRKDSYEYEVLKAWIAAGCPKPKSNVAAVIGLTVTPTNRVYQIDRTQQLRAVAHYSDGSTRDVTNRAKYDSLGESVAQVDQGGFVTAVGHGQAAIMVRYEGQAKISHVLSPFAENVDLADFQPNNFVDERVRAHWQKLGVKPTGLCTDAEFLRRAFLDSIGTLPTPKKIDSFLKSSDSNKRVVLVDELLGRTGDPRRDVYVNEWSAYWTLKWGDLLRNNRNTLGDGGMWALANWIRQSLRENKPVDQFVREIITAQGSIYQNGPANYYKIARNAPDLAETTAQVFLGIRLQCARCHHHPFEVYSQGDYYGLAAFFTRVGTKASTDFGALGADTVVKLNSSGSIRHPRTGKTMQPTPLGEKPIDANNVRDLRRPLADWLTSPKNRLFARNIVNRIWGYYMGTGLVESIDDMRATNPPSNPELLDALAADFVANGFDLKKLMRAIMTSRVYQLSSTPRPEHVADTRFYLHYNIKRLPAEVLLDGIDFACQTQERFAGVPPGTRAIELPGPHYTSYFLDTLGRPQRVIACECERTADPNLAQVLHIANSELVNRKLSDKNGRISKLMASKKNDEDAIKTLYLVTLSRHPSGQETANCRQIITRAGNHREGLEDILWALINSREFLFNH